jgi:hypothetical protein
MAPRYVKKILDFSREKNPRKSISGNLPISPAQDMQSKSSSYKENPLFFTERKIRGKVFQEIY